MRKSKANNLPMVLFYMLILPIMAGCAPAHFRAHPQLQEKGQSIKTVAIMPPGVKIYQLAVGGGTELMDGSTEAAKQVVSTAIEKELQRHVGVVFKPSPTLSPSSGPDRDLTVAGIRDELEDTQALFEAVSASVWLHTYSHGGKARDPDFPEKLKNFDYSLGPEVQRLAKLARADALIFTSGADYIPTGGRAALTALGVLVGAAALVTLNPAPIVAVATAGGPARLSVGLVDATTGALLWYNVVPQGGLTDPDSATDLAEGIFKDFPLGTRSTRERPQDPFSCLPSCPRPTRDE